MLAGFTAFLNLYATQPLLPLLMDVFDASHLEVSVTVTAPTVAVALAAPAAGRLADSIGRKRVIVGCSLLLAAATALAACSSSLTQLVGWRFLQGLVTPGIFAIAVAYIHDEWPVGQVGRATALYISGNVVGGFSGRAVSGLVAASHGWRAAFIVLASVNLAAAFAVWRWLPGGRQPIQTSRTGGSMPPILHTLRNRRLLSTFAVGLGVLFTQVAMFTYVTFHLSAAPYLLSTRALGSLFVVYLLGAAVTPATGRWIDRRGHPRTLAKGVAIATTGALLTLVPSLAAIVAGLALVATGVFVAQATASSYIGIVTTEGRGLAVGLYASSYYAGGSLGGTLPGLFWERGGWAAAVGLVLLVQLTIATIALRTWTDRPGFQTGPTD